jgi:dCMP deaminase
MKEKPFSTFVGEDISESDQKWHHRFMEMADVVAKFSKDPSSQVGAVAVNEKRQMYQEGFNGFPKKIADTPERLNDRETKYKYILHAEQNLLSNACSNKVSLENSTVYISGIPPCERCALILIQADVSTIVVKRVDIARARESWMKSWKFSFELFKEAKVEVVFI